MARAATGLRHSHPDSAVGKLGRTIPPDLTSFTIPVPVLLKHRMLWFLDRDLFDSPLRNQPRNRLLEPLRVIEGLKLRCLPQDGKGARHGRIQPELTSGSQT